MHKHHKPTARTQHVTIVVLKRMLFCYLEEEDVSALHQWVHDLRCSQVFTLPAAHDLAAKQHMQKQQQQQQQQQQRQRRQQRQRQDMICAQSGFTLPAAHDLAAKRKHGTCSSSSSVRA
jgi:RimJ/RimL family protein N-acetyltransferase